MRESLAAMNPTDVNPGAWSDHEVIFNDPAEEYSAVWGKFRGKLCLGTRWNGDPDQRGYPGQGEYPLWFVEPDYLVLPILQRLYLLSMRGGLINSRGELFSDKISIAIREFLQEQNTNL